MNDKRTSEALIFGFDIGIASVGWAVLAPHRITALGVRAFNKAETAKEGEPLNLVRRTARLMRRRLRRRAWRLRKLARLLVRLCAADDAAVLRSGGRSSPWRLRVEALERRLDREEWARVLYHLCKHRGFHWQSRAEEKRAEADAKGEGGKVKQGLAGTEALMKERGYRTAAEMVLREFPGAQRNKQGEYRKALARRTLAAEMTRLFARQRELGNPHASTDLELALLGDGDRKSGLFWAQKPALAGADLLKMLGRCTFEKEEFRAPKASFSAERHVWLTKLGNLQIVLDGDTRLLDPGERAAVLALPYSYATDLTYERMRAALVKAGLPERFRFRGLPYPSEAERAESRKDPEKGVLVKQPGWQALRQAFKAAGLETEWKGIAGAALDGRPELLDRIAWVLSVFKEDDEVRGELQKLHIPGGETLIEALLDVRFDRFHALSLKALRAILPHMESGLRYDEACTRAGYHHSRLFVPGAGTHRTLPALYSGRATDGRMVLNEDLDPPRNPVALRAINQARKVLNALVRKYGPPHEVRVEMARDLSRALDERRKIEKEQTGYRERNEKEREMFVEHFGRPPKGPEFEKWRLYREQNGKCAYSVKALDLARILEDGYAEIDHALPYSRGFDDSRNNKVLVLAEENRDKGNRTPYEYLGGSEESARWRQFVAFVEANKAYRLAKRARLLRKDFGAKAAEEFRERNLNDTRYVCRFFKNLVERHLQLGEGSEAKRCVVVSGQLTAFLRTRWGLLKVRDDSDRHHALDAAVVAACTHGFVKRLSDYSRRKELARVRNRFVDPETGEVIGPASAGDTERFPAPWPLFRQELEALLKIEEPERLRNEMRQLGTYPDTALETLRPLFVSRAPQRRNGGAAHKETIYGQTERLRKKGAVTQRVPLNSLSLKDLDRLIDPHRNEKLYTAIRARLEANGGKGDRAFPPENPLRKPDRNGQLTGPVVRSATLVIENMSGIPVRGGVARNDTMLRVDVFANAGRFHLVPVYVHHRVKGLPARAIVAYKDEEDWTPVDELPFCFSLYPNDLVRVKLRKETFMGYYAGCDRSTGAISLWAHDRASTVGKDGLIRGIGVKMAIAIEKLHVDVLGNIHPARPEQRRGLA